MRGVKGRVTEHVASVGPGVEHWVFDLHMLGVSTGLVMTYVLSCAAVRKMSLAEIAHEIVKVFHRLVLFHQLQLSLEST